MPTRLESMLEEARAQGLRPWLAIKETLARAVLIAAAPSADGAVLQGGAALHFAYGSPRLSADVDFSGDESVNVLESRGPAIAEAAGGCLGLPARWSLVRRGRLARGKVSVEIDAVRRLVLPVEAYSVAARLPRAVPTLGAAEAPEEIAADKIVASADRLARRGTLKTTDLYDLWYIRERLGLTRPDPALVEAKIADYGGTRHAVDAAAAARALAPEELRAVLEGALPAREQATIDARAILAAAAEWLEALSDVL
jgi:predicted nucleotidyltransferase component of viral defense system